MAGLLEFAVFADQRVEILPKRLRAQRQRVLARKAALQAQVSEIDAARLLSDDALFDKRHALAAPCEEEGGPDTDQAAADDRDICRSRAHAGSFAAASAIGLTGA